MRVAFGTSILVYAEQAGRGPGEEAKAGTALDVLGKAAPAGLVLPAQALGELYNVLVRKRRVPRDGARDAVAAWVEVATEVRATTPAVLADALDLAAEHGLQVWDAVILAASAEAGCAYLLSEDLHAGFAHRGCGVANPFASPLPPRLARLLS